MPTTSLAGTVQDSKAQRQERLKTRFRDRGGIFVPSDGNPLADILLARGINGESPVKKRAPRKSAVTHKPRPSMASSRAKTPRTGSSKRRARKSAAVPSEEEETHPLPARKRRGALKTPKLPEGKRINGVDTSISAGPSRSRASTQRMPFADQLADAINSTKPYTVPDACSSSMKVRPVVPTRAPGTPPLSGKSERALDKCKAEPTAALLEPSGGELVCASKATIVERQQREKQDIQRGFAVQESEQATEAGMKEMKPPLPHDLGESDSDSEVPLAKKRAVVKSKSAWASTGPRTKPGKSKEDAPPPPKKRRGRSKAKAPNPDSRPPRTTTVTGVDAGGGGRTVQVLQEKIAPVKVPRKRKERTQASLDRDDNNEQTHGPPKKKRRGTDPTTSRGGKENKEMSRSAREAAAKVEMDKPLPSPMKQPARARPKPASKAKAKTVKPPSRAGVNSATGTRSRGLPLNVRRRIKAIAQNPPAIGVVDDDDPIDFLR